MRLFVALTFMLLVVSACSDADAGGTDDGDFVAGTLDLPRIISVDASEFSFQPDSLMFAPGETVEFIVTNRGNILHEFELTNEAGVAAHQADDGNEDRSPLFVSVRPGETMSVRVTFDDAASDLTRFVCFVPGHFEAGMWGELSRR